MKKFYEQPVVEITVFDEESIMTASTVETARLTPEQLQAMVDEDINNNKAGVTVQAKAYSSTYGW